MTTIEHLNPEGLASNPAFTHAVVVAGPHRTVYVGGQNALDEHGDVMGRGDIAAQARHALMPTPTGEHASVVHDISAFRSQVRMRRGTGPGGAPDEMANMRALCMTFLHFARKFG